MEIGKFSTTALAARLPILQEKVLEAKREEDQASTRLLEKAIQNALEKLERNPRTVAEVPDSAVALFFKEAGFYTDVHESNGRITHRVAVCRPDEL